MFFDSPLTSIASGCVRLGASVCCVVQVDMSVSFDQVGGLGGHLKALKEMIFLPLVYPELFERFHITPPRGVLFYGPPGTLPGHARIATLALAFVAKAPRGQDKAHGGIVASLDIPSMATHFPNSSQPSVLLCRTGLPSQQIWGHDARYALGAGTGKTLVARALAAQAGRAGAKVSFFMRKGADVLSKWVGEAERQLKMLFEEAQRCQPSIIFFDEIDGLAPVRGLVCLSRPRGLPSLVEGGSHHHDGPPANWSRCWLALPPIATGACKPMGPCLHLVPGHCVSSPPFGRSLLAHCSPWTAAPG
jgi:ATPase family associated with various cellular activities (AAA)